MRNIKSIKLKDHIYISLIIIGCLQLFVSSELFIIIEALYLLILFCKSKGKINLGNNVALMLLLLIFLIGLLGGVDNIGTRHYVRDIFYFFNPVIALLIGMHLSDDKACNNKILNSIILISLFTNIYSLGLALVSISKGIQISGFRASLDRAMWGNVVTIGILLIRLNKNKEKFLNKKSILLFLMILVVILGTSRTLWIETIIMLLVLLISDKSKMKKILKSIKYILFLVLVTVVLVSFFDINYNSILKKFGNSFNEISYENEEWNSNSIQSNWRGFEIKQAIEQFRKNSFLQKMLGNGFGEGIYVGKYANLVHQSGNYIYVIHNGYYDILVKEGIIGLILYLLFYVYLCIQSLKIYKITKDKNDILILGITLCLILYTYLVKGIFNDYQQFNALIVIGGWLRYRRKSELNKEIELKLESE